MAKRAKSKLVLHGKEIRTLYDALDVIRERPGMWIGEPSLTGLWHLLHGFFAGIGCTGMRLEPEDPSFEQFHDYVEDRWKLPRSTRGYRTTLLYMAGLDEKLALEYFWSTLDEFRTAKRSAR